MERLKFAGTVMNQHSSKTSKATKHEEHSFGAIYYRYTSLGNMVHGK